MRASGQTGALRVGYQKAADLGDWSLDLKDGDPRWFSFRARLLRTHAHWITQRPIDLVLSLGTTEWTWRGVDYSYVSSNEIEIAIRSRPEVAERAPSPVARSIAS